MLVFVPSSLSLSQYYVLISQATPPNPLASSVASILQSLELFLLLSLYNSFFSHTLHHMPLTLSHLSTIYDLISPFVFWVQTYHAPCNTVKFSSLWKVRKFLAIDMFKDKGKEEEVLDKSPFLKT